MTYIGKLLVGLVFAVYLASATQGLAADGELALVGGKVYPSPTSQPIDDAVVLVKDGKITAVGKRAVTVIPRAARVITCWDKVIVAGFWNSHVHFETGWEDAAHAPVEKLESHMQEMLTRWGFTTVWDLGSDPQNTLTIRQRIEAGELAGPKILMAGDIFPKNGHPVYLPAELKLPEAATPQEAEQMAQQYMKMGLDGIKLFTGAYMGAKPTVNMDTAIVRAAVDVAHAQGKPVFTHPQNRSGVDNALAGGVDILAHTIPTEGQYTPDELRQMKEQHTALIPTLTLWTTVLPDPVAADRLAQAGVDELQSYFSQNGIILFGTDVGFQSKYDTTQEFELMGRAMPWRDVLASLTTNPAAFFKTASAGKVEVGMDADLVVLTADPASDVRNLGKVAYTIRAGRVIYSGAEKK